MVVNGKGVRVMDAIEEDAPATDSRFVSDALAEGTVLGVIVPLIGCPLTIGDPLLPVEEVVSAALVADESESRLDIMTD